MTATCSICDRPNCKVRSDYTQATRKERSRFLGFSGYCPNCDCSFKIESPQLEISEQLEEGGWKMLAERYRSAVEAAA